MLRTANSTLLANGNTTFVVNPANGTVTLGTVLPGVPNGTAARSDLIVDPQGTTEYFTLLLEPAHFPPLNGWHVSGANLTSLPPTPVPSGLRGVDWPLAVDPTGKFLYAARGTAQDLVGPLTLEVFPRNADGSLSPMTLTSRGICGSGTPLSPVGDQIGKAVTAKGTRTFLYVACSNANTLEFTVMDNTSGAVLSSGSVSVPGVPTTVNGATNAMAIDPTGSFLLVIDSPGHTVDVYTIDAATGSPSSQPVTRVSTMRAPNSLVFDVTGQFVYVVDSCPIIPSPPPCPEDGEIFAYALNSGKLNPLPASPYKAGGNGTSTITVMKQ